MKNLLEAKGIEIITNKEGKVLVHDLSYSLNKARSAKSSGYSWWSYQDMDFPP